MTKVDTSDLDTSDMAAYQREYSKRWRDLHPEYMRTQFREKWSKYPEGRPKTNAHIKPREEDERYRTEDVRITRWASKARINLKKSAGVRGIEWSEVITSRWIHEQFRKQQGRCFYTGVPFEITAAKRGLRRPSLDRIDSGVGSVPGNVVLCLVAVNYAKNDATAEELCAVLQAIADENSRT